MTSLNFFFVRNYSPDNHILSPRIFNMVNRIFKQKILKSIFTDIFPFFTEFNGLSA
jgi:hypothetical protein